MVGAATLAALGLAIVSGFAIALGGTDWWHTNPVGHFVIPVGLHLPPSTPTGCRCPTPAGFLARCRADHSMYARHLQGAPQP
jgi:hypothetical protein